MFASSCSHLGIVPLFRFFTPQPLSSGYGYYFLPPVPWIFLPPFHSLFSFSCRFRDVVFILQWISTCVLRLTLQRSFPTILFAPMTNRVMYFFGGPPPLLVVCTPFLLLCLLHLFLWAIYLAPVSFRPRLCFFSPSGFAPLIISVLSGPRA